MRKKFNAITIFSPRCEEVSTVVGVSHIGTKETEGHQRRSDTWLDRFIVQYVLWTTYLSNQEELEDTLSIIVKLQLEKEYQ